MGNYPQKTKQGLRMAYNAPQAHIPICDILPIWLHILYHWQTWRGYPNARLVYWFDLFYALIRLPRVFYPHAYTLLRFVGLFLPVQTHLYLMRYICMHKLYLVLHMPRYPPILSRDYIETCARYQYKGTTKPNDMP